MFGFWDNLLYVNLTTREIWFEKLNDVWQKYMGGIGIATYLFSKIGYKGDPYSPENPIIIMTGPLVGTAFPNTGRHEIVSRSPLTNFLGESNSGGHFGYQLKRAGIDGIIIIGKAEEPTAIYIMDGNISIENAKNLWGLDIYSVQKKVEEKGKFSVMTIGPAGENLVYFSSVMNDEGRAAGRTGLGAVFGSKKLKLIAVNGKKVIPLYRKDEFNKLSAKVAKEIYESPIASGFRSFGSMIWMDGGQGFGDIPANYFIDHNFPYDSLSSIKFHEIYKVDSYHCSSCVIGCGRTVKFKDMSIDGPEYETVAAFGPLIGNNNFELILKWNHISNSLGIDTISLGVLLSGLKFFIEKGYLKGNINEYFGQNFENVEKLISDIAYKRNLGEYLSLGLERYARMNGIDKDLIATVKGLEIPMHDPRAFKLQGLIYAISSRGADHMQGDMYQVDIGGAHEEIGIISGDRWNVNSDERVYSAIKTEDYRQIYNSLILCYYASPSPQKILQAYNLATGFNIKLDEMMKIGSRIVNEKRKINESLGLKKDDDYLPRIVRSRIDNEQEESEITDEELKSLIDKYYKLRGW
ncbi:MAG: aldehyde ferredoxin oxidoreductase family protein [Thermoplasmata archaeon]